MNWYDIVTVTIAAIITVAVVVSLFRIFKDQ